MQSLQPRNLQTVVTAPIKSHHMAEVIGYRALERDTY